jgi:hypothetical protein
MNKKLRLGFLWPGRGAVRNVVGLALGIWAVSAAASTNSGLWVGEISLNAVNESVGGVNAANQLVFTDPSITTPTPSAAHLRLILHVDSLGQVRLLKSVAILPKTNGQAVTFALITDPSLYPNYSDSGVGNRLTAAAFDFGDANAENILNQVAAAAAAAAAAGNDAVAAANLVIAGAATNALLPSSGYQTFIGSATFQSSAGIAGAAATAAVQAAPSASAGAKLTLAKGAALKALTDGHIFDAADAVVAHEVVFSGSVSPGSTVTGTIFLGASHPTNPFMHRRHPDHPSGYQITRALTLTFDTANSPNAQQTAGFGVDQISGTYSEEIFGLHKPLGQNQDIGLRTAGTIVLNRVSQVDTLNQ